MHIVVADAIQAVRGMWAPDFALMGRDEDAFEL